MNKRAVHVFLFILAFGWGCNKKQTGDRVNGKKKPSKVSKDTVGDLLKKPLAEVARNHADFKAVVSDPRFDVNQVDQYKRDPLFYAQYYALFTQGEAQKAYSAIIATIMNHSEWLPRDPKMVNTLIKVLQIYVRHSESENNQLAKMSGLFSAYRRGKNLDPPLTEKEIKETMEVANAIKIIPHLIFVSILVRAMQTARYIFPNCKAPLVVSPYLKENGMLPLFKESFDKGNLPGTIASQKELLGDQADRLDYEHVIHPTDPESFKKDLMKPDMGAFENWKQEVFPTLFSQSNKLPPDPNKEPMIIANVGYSGAFRDFFLKKSSLFQAKGKKPKNSGTIQITSWFDISIQKFLKKGRLGSFINKEQNTEEAQILHVGFD